MSIIIAMNDFRTAFNIFIVYYTENGFGNGKLRGASARRRHRLLCCRISYGVAMWYPIDIIIFDMYAVRIASSAIFSTFLGTKYYNPRIETEPTEYYPTY